MSVTPSAGACTHAPAARCPPTVCSWECCTGWRLTHRRPVVPSRLSPRARFVLVTRMQALEKTPQTDHRPHRIPLICPPPPRGWTTTHYNRTGSMETRVFFQIWYQLPVRRMFKIRHLSPGRVRCVQKSGSTRAFEWSITLGV